MVAQLTCLKGLKIKLVAQWKNFTEVLVPAPEAKAKALQLPLGCKASSSSQPASAGVIRSAAPVIRLTEDQIQLELALEETAEEYAETKKVLVKQIEKKLATAC